MNKARIFKIAPLLISMAALIFAAAALLSVRKPVCAEEHLTAYWPDGDLTIIKICKEWKK